MKQVVYKDSQAVAEAFADFLAKEIAKSSIFHVALSGGSTPKLLFTHLAKEYADKIDWKKVHLYWGDERCVAPTDEESNYKMTNELLLKNISIPFDNIHRVLGRRNPQEEAIRYGKEIEWCLPLKNTMPVFDLIILGMGGDGHTASIFPHEMKFIASDKTCIVATHPTSGQKRVSLTGEVINQAKQVHFLVTGASKTKVVKEIFTKTGNYETYPAAHIEGATWWMDEVAANG